MDSINHIKDFFKRFKNLTPPHEAIKKSVQKAIKRHTNTTLDLKNIKIVRDTIVVTTSPSFKNQIFLYKTKILSDVSEDVGGRVCDIR